MEVTRKTTAPERETVSGTSQAEQSEGKGPGTGHQGGKGGAVSKGQL